MRYHFFALLLVAGSSTFAQNPGGISGAADWHAAATGTSTTTDGAGVQTRTGSGSTPPSYIQATSGQDLRTKPSALCTGRGNRLAFNQSSGSVGYTFGLVIGGTLSGTVTNGVPGLAALVVNTAAHNRW